MHERDVELEARVCRSFGTLDTIDVPALTALTTRQAQTQGSRTVRMATALGAATAVLVLALIVGAQLNTVARGAVPAERRHQGRLASPGEIATDQRYGMLVQLPGGAVTLVDEGGRQLLPVLPAFSGLTEAKTSPDGRYVALWLSTGSGFELRILDGVSRSLEPALFATTERYARSNEGWSGHGDSSAVLLTTTSDPTANSAGDIRVNLRTIDRAGNVRVIATYTAFVLQPLGWDRAKNTILARATPGSGGPSKYLRFVDGGTSSVVERSVTDMPLIANDDANFAAALASCPSPGPCRTFTIHDAETYAVVAQIDLERFGYR